MSPRTILTQDAPAESLTTTRLSNTHEKILHQQDQQRSKKMKKRHRTLYFAYGSNLSPTQMRLRCEHDPSVSGRPVALARLDHWRWLICERGYANVIPPREWRVGRQVAYGEGVPKSSVVKSQQDGEDGGRDEDDGEGEAGKKEQDVVFGVLYEMTPEDEFLLDGYEGVDHSAPESLFANQIALDVRPREQENGAYNKWYVPARVVKWLYREGQDEHSGHNNQDYDYQDDDDDDDDDENNVTVLVYVDEKRVSLGPPKWEYIGRMNRAIAESVELGIPRDWVQSVMRKAIPES